MAAAARSFVLPPPAADGQDDDKNESGEPDSETDDFQQREIVQQVGSNQIVLKGKFGAVMAGDVVGAEALEAADNVDASAAVLARRRLAFVDVDRTGIASESAALTDRPATTFLADAAVFTRIRIAIAAVFAALATKTGRAFATVVVVEVVTSAVEKTRRRSARIAVDLAARADEASPTSALVA